MRLYIGKNHQRKDTVRVQSIFRLAGSDEDALTFALGYLIASDRNLCAKLVKRCGVAQFNPSTLDYSIHLQEVTDIGFGRRDIVIEAKGTRVVIEAKIGGAEPTPEQILKYATEHGLWDQYATRAVVALTQVELPTARTEHIRSLLSGQGIHFANVQWHQVIEVVLGHRYSKDSVDSRYLLDEFVRFVRRDYDMGYYDAEILVQDVNPLNAKIFREGWMYVTSPKDKKAPLYFAPYFTQQGANTGISMISRVLDAKTQRLADSEDVGEALTPEHLNRWRSGLCMLRERADNEGFSNFEARLFFLDRPIALLTPPLTKKAFKLSASSKQIPNQIPKGFSLRFDDLLMSGSKIGPP